MVKDLCAKRGVPLGGANEEKVNRLVEVAQKDGELDEIVVKMNRDARRHAYPPKLLTHSCGHLPPPTQLNRHELIVQFCGVIVYVMDNAF